MRPRNEIEDERAINAAWQAISHAHGEARNKRILFYAQEGTPAVKAWVETKFRATLQALNITDRADCRACRATALGLPTPSYFHVENCPLRRPVAEPGREEGGAGE